MHHLIQSNTPPPHSRDPTHKHSFLVLGLALVIMLLLSPMYLYKHRAMKKLTEFENDTKNAQVALDQLGVKMNNSVVCTVGGCFESRHKPAPPSSPRRRCHYL